MMKQLFVIVFSLLAVSTVQAKALFDLVDIQGDRENQLVGYGLVVGLPNSGDKTQVKYTAQSLNNMLKQFGVQLDERSLPKSKNIAAVSVTASLPSTASPGQKLDVTVMSLGDAKSLQGGSLMLTPLRGVDGDVYALAQGNLVVGGATASGMNGSSVTINIPTAGVIPNGAVVEKAVSLDNSVMGDVVLNLKQPNYQTARNMVLAINQVFGPKVATAVNQGKLTLAAPQNANQRLTFMSMLQDIDITEGSSRPKVIFNSRAGTVVMNDVVRVKRAAVSHGNLTITIAEQEQVSQPGPFSNGNTARTQSSSVSLAQEQTNMMLWPEGTSLDKIVNAINALGATPAELMSILIALDKAGALEGELVVI